MSSYLFLYKKWNLYFSTLCFLVKILFLIKLIFFLIIYIEIKKIKSYYNKSFFFNAQLALIKFKQVFIKVTIFCYFKFERYIQIKTDICINVISKILVLSTSNHINSWDSVVFFIKNKFFIILQYNTFVDKLLNILKIFENRIYYFENLNYKIYILIYKNKLY